MDAGMTGDAARSNEDRHDTGEADIDTLWPQVAPRLADYLRALGVREADDRDHLLAAIRARLAARLALGPLRSPPEAAIGAALAVLDDWLRRELGAAASGPTLRLARTAVLSGGVPGWTARWAGRSDEALSEQILAACLAAVPEPAPLAMEPQPIHRLGHGLGRRLAGLLRRAPEAGRPR